MTALQFFAGFWWLLFPIGGMLMGVFAMFGEFRHRSDTIKLIKTYADQGKDPPQALLDALKSDEERSHDYGYYGRRRWRRNRGGWWWQMTVFAALAGGFGYYGYYGDGNHVFVALAIGFGVAAVAMFALSVIRAVTQPRYPDDHDPRP